MSASKSSSVKCVRDARDLPLESYRLPDDGRKWKRLAIDRQRLCIWLASYANGDGSSITVGVPTLAVKLGMGRSTVFRRLQDLGPKGLGILLTDGQIPRPGQAPGTSRRSLNLAPLRGVPDSGGGVQDSSGKGVPDSEGEASQIEGGGVPDSVGRRPALRGTRPTITDHNRPLPPTLGGGGFVDSKTSDEENPNHHPGGGSPAGRDVVAYLKHTFQETHGTLPWPPSKEQVEQLVDLATVHGEDFKRAWQIFLAEGPSRPDTHSPYGVFITDFTLWHRPTRKQTTKDLTPPWATSSKGAL